jgi:hypothetical protein
MIPARLICETGAKAVILIEIIDGIMKCNIGLKEK